MIPSDAFRSIRAIPGKTFDKLWKISPKESSLLARVAKIPRNMVAFVATVCSVVFAALAILLLGIYNIVAWSVISLVSLHNNKPLPNKDYDYVAIGTLPLHLARPVGKVVTVNTPTSQSGVKTEQTDTLTENVFGGQASFSEEVTDFWSFIQQFVLADGDYTNFPIGFASKLLPTKQPLEDENANSAQELVFQIQTDPVMASKYLLTTYACLKAFGVEIDHTGQIYQSDDFATRAQYVNNPQCQQIFLLLVRSLVDCGFGSLALQAIGFLTIHCNTLGYSTSPGETPSSKLTQTVEYVLKTTLQLPDNSSWTSDSQISYLNTFPSPRGKDILPASLDQPPRWVSKEISSAGDPVFHGADRLLQWDEEKKVWKMSSFSLPPWFRTKEEHTDYLAVETAQEQKLTEVQKKREALNLAIDQAFIKWTQEELQQKPKDSQLSPSEDT